MNHHLHVSITLLFFSNLSCARIVSHHFTSHGALDRHVHMSPSTVFISTCHRTSLTPTFNGIITRQMTQFAYHLSIQNETCFFFLFLTEQYLLLFWVLRFCQESTAASTSSAARLGDPPSPATRKDLLLRRWLQPGEESLLLSTDPNSGLRLGSSSSAEPGCYISATRIDRAKT